MNRNELPPEVLADPSLAFAWVNLLEEQQPGILAQYGLVRSEQFIKAAEVLSAAARATAPAGLIIEPMQ